MRDRKPPALAVRLLDALGYSKQNAALAGDLLEEFRSGRSRAWYWRQTAIVIATGIRRNAGSRDTLIGGCTAFGILALIDYAFWRLHRSAEIRDWIQAVVVLLLAGVIIVGAVRRRKRDGKSLLLMMVAWLSLMCFGAWTSSRSLADRMWNDLGTAALGWAAVVSQAPRQSRNRRSG